MYGQRVWQGTSLAKWQLWDVCCDAYKRLDTWELHEFD